MATQFTATVKPSGGDYTSLNAAVIGLVNDLTLATIRVFLISSYSIPTIVAGDAVRGNTSLATGVCVLVNATRTQILIRAIVGTFQNGEIVQKTTDANVNVALSSVGDSPIIGIECYSMLDTTRAVIEGYTTSATNYIHIYTPKSERHDGKWNVNKYRLEVTDIPAWGSMLEMNVNFIKVDGLQLHIILSGETIANRNAIGPGYNKLSAGAELQISNCIIKGDQSGTGDISYFFGIGDSTGQPYAWTLKAWNNIIYNFWDRGGYSQCAGIELSTNAIAYLYNNTIHNSRNGIWDLEVVIPPVIIAINNIVQYTTYGFNGIFDTLSDYNCSDSGNAPGLHSITGTALFINEAAEDYHLDPSDTVAKNHGVSDPGSGLFSDDIDGQIRPIELTWDIGADEAACSTVQISFEVI